MHSLPVAPGVRDCNDCRSSCQARHTNGSSSISWRHRERNSIPSEEPCPVRPDNPPAQDQSNSVERHLQCPRSSPRKSPQRSMARVSQFRGKRARLTRVITGTTMFNHSSPVKFVFLVNGNLTAVCFVAIFAVIAVSPSILLDGDSPS